MPEYSNIVDVIKLIRQNKYESVEKSIQETQRKEDFEKLVTNLE